ncbi:2-C-methyl-D-erythritol 2,4-cyclodiphosphate synthase [bacterium]|nr:2-C-methyl-D-erythritol 2,4-cyclodiphosphate synthase [bacterium]MBU4560905.1 2-C-methyl-D-erythritol 2,4-cyclodiphosphate synthase [bacterium]MCG2676535.1 2-C-methyl-D-erythritol 2,4-cyclodiphosphate synthase [bacterium]MCG2677465.1 2-C-methyl-D-erythritol 2,4-cyclodiphosphate synthase [bacterium]
MKVGMGYDVHKLVEGRRLILGGVEIPFGRGLLGHSDGDVLLHAICDALLGAAGKGDIGQHFPDTNPEYKDISSLILIEKVKGLTKEYKINNIDSIIIAQEPKLAPYLSKMKENITKVLKIDKSKINIKATTTEGLGSIGRGEGIAAYAMVSLE